MVGLVIIFQKQQKLPLGKNAGIPAEYVIMDNVIEFKPKETVYILKFTAPSPLKMTKAGGENMTVEINKVDDSHGLGQAWVPAKNLHEARTKLNKMIEILEWLED